MTTDASAPAAVSPDRALHRLFLTLFLRGRSSRGLRRNNMPRSVASKLLLTLLAYGCFGCFALAFVQRPVFEISIYLHGMTLLFCGMFIAASSGEILFNKEEADILLHRPVTPQALLRAKLTVLLQVSLWIAGAFNLAGMVAGVLSPNGNALYPLAHALSTVLEAVFCAGGVVLAYELCLRSFGREKLEGIMTTVQVLVAVGTVVAGQLVPRVIGRATFQRGSIGIHPWWFDLLPPAWFAGLDDAITGNGGIRAMTLAVIGVACTSLVAWLALGRMARHYETGMQLLGETTSAVPASQLASRRWLDALVHSPLLSWWLRNPVRRAAFVLVASYLVRDRDVKLRVYPGLAPLLVMPIAFMMPVSQHGADPFGGFGVAFCGAYMGMIPLFALSLLQYSQQWQAGDVFRAAPIPGPALLCAGARQAVTCFITIPLMVFFTAVVYFLRHTSAELPLLLPGLIALPAFTLAPHLGGKAIPFSKAGEEARSARRGLDLFGVILVSISLSLVAIWAWSMGWFHWFLLSEIAVVGVIYTLMRVSLTRAPWPSME
ncbi:hypothetical protein CfE428DRAFT_1038 [Chthoniobacter flavus Ellin428]|uniref:ABC-2 type transport system permease protein n=1 Tax=Chthoniobacter flavus Ellin428 TaxID=497964 RepID=B4CWK0_9BACT|nr:hypothetical protein [Chthoniobacter flavus]EDY21792.1 hypothetical protein CfE428DRAFT_1038 [Chthoniobacter flavus Ellin428]TCO95722.1 hypothetical protein EV701_101413 [Chthoniobacter flavus]